MSRGGCVVGIGVEGGGGVVLFNNVPFHSPLPLEGEGREGARRAFMAKRRGERCLLIVPFYMKEDALFSAKKCHVRGNERLGRPWHIWVLSRFLSLC